MYFLGLVVWFSPSTNDRRCLAVNTRRMASLHCSLYYDRRLVSLWKSKMAANPTRKRLTLAGRFGHVRIKAKIRSFGYAFDSLKRHSDRISECLIIYAPKQIKNRCVWMPKQPTFLSHLVKLFAAASINRQAQEKITSFCETWQIGVAVLRRESAHPKHNFRT